MIYSNLSKNLCKAFFFLGFALLLGACEREEDPAGLTPVIAQIDKTTLNAGDIVELAGRNFGSSPEALTVNFNGRIAEVLEVSDNRLLVTVPAGAGSGQLRVIRNERSSNAYPYAYRFRLGGEESVQIVPAPANYGGQRFFQVAADGNFYLGAPLPGEIIQLYRFSLSGNTFEAVPNAISGTNIQFLNFFVDANGVYYYSGLNFGNFGIYRENNPSVLLTLPTSPNTFVIDAQGNLYYPEISVLRGNASRTNFGGKINRVNLNNPTAPPVLFASTPGFINSFVLGRNNTVWMLQEGGSTNPSIIYEGGSNRAPRQIFDFSSSNFGDKKLSFASDINLLCASAGDILYLYDTFGAASYEITLPTDWGVIGAVLGAGGELYVVAFDDEYTIRRVILQ